MERGSRPICSHAVFTRSHCSLKRASGANGRLYSAAYFAASIGVRFGPPPPTMIGGWGCCAGLGSAGESEIE